MVAQRDVRGNLELGSDFAAGIRLVLERVELGLQVDLPELIGGQIRRGDQQ
jgi:hypothetical protein